MEPVYQKQKHTYGRLGRPPLIYTRQYCTTAEDEVLCYIEQEGRKSLFTPACTQNGAAPAPQATLPSVCANVLERQRCSNSEFGARSPPALRPAHRKPPLILGLTATTATATSRRDPKTGRAPSRSEAEDHEKQLFAAVSREMACPVVKPYCPGHPIAPTFILYKTGLLTTAM